MAAWAWLLIVAVSGVCNSCFRAPSVFAPRVDGGAGGTIADGGTPGHSVVYFQADSGMALTCGIELADGGVNSAWGEGAEFTEVQTSSTGFCLGYPAVPLVELCVGPAQSDGGASLVSPGSYPVLAFGTFPSSPEAPFARAQLTDSESGLQLNFPSGQVVIDSDNLHHQSGSFELLFDLADGGVVEYEGNFSLDRCL